MTVDLVVNTCLILFISSNLAILYMSNIGYVLCHVLALSGFLLLRKDRPNWPRPVKVSAPWVAMAGVLTVYYVVILRRRRRRAEAQRLRHLDRLRHRRRHPGRLGAAVLLPANRPGQGEHPLEGGDADDARGRRPRRADAGRLDARGRTRSRARGRIGSTVSRSRSDQRHMRFLASWIPEPAGSNGPRRSAAV